MSTTHDTPAPPVKGALGGPVVADLAAKSTPGIAALDAQWAARVLAGQAIDYAVEPGPAAALADALRMTGLTPGTAARWPR